MKVIFFPNNTSSLVSIHVSSLRKQGVEAVGYNFAPLKINDKDCVYNWPQVEKNLIFQRFLFLFHFVSDLLSSDVIHWMYGGNSKLARIMLFFVGLLNKKKFVEFCGTDIRSLEKMLEDIPYYKMSDFSDNFIHLMGVSETSEATQKRFSRAGFHPLPSYPELTDYIDPKYFPSYSLIARSVNLNRLSPIPFSNTKPVVVHAPSSPEVKGTKYVNEAALKLEEEGLIQYKLITNMTHEEALNALKTADVVVDQIVAGDYGVLAIEGMALEKPVICFIRPKILSYYQKHFEDFPIVNANITNIYSVLKSLVTDRNLMKEIGNRSRTFAMKYHDPEANTKKLIEIYRNK